MWNLAGNGANLDSGSNMPWGKVCFGRLPVAARIVTLTLLCGLTTRARSQQSFYSIPEEAAATALPEDPQTRQSTAQAGPALPPGSIRGIIVDRDGTAYEGVHIQLTPRPSITETSAPAQPRAAASDGNGRFAFGDVPPGAFQLTVSSSGFVTRIVSGVLKPGDSLEEPPIVLVLDSTISQVRVTATQQEIALAQLREEEKQRIFGVIPNYYVTYVPHAPPLTSGQKYDLAWKSSIDPVTIGIAAAFAGVEQATNDFSGYGQGAEGYAKRFGAAYADAFIGTMIGGAVLPSLFKQDPRYFYKGTGTTRSRVLYAVSMSVICKGDNGHWQLNYSGILGGLAAGGISNAYYPASNRDGATLTFENALIGIAGSAVQNIFQEFLVRRLTPKVPNYEPSKP